MKAEESGLSRYEDPWELLQEEQVKEMAEAEDEKQEWVFVGKTKGA
jgi:hypothetical protein